MPEPVLDVRNLRIRFTSDNRRVMAVDQASFTVPRGQTLAIVGESGSGKSVSCLAAMGLIPCPPGEILSGEIWFRDRDRAEPINLLKASPKQLQTYRGGKISMIFQEPMSALNPVYTCGSQIVEAIRLHDPVSETAARRRALALLREVKLLPTDEDLAENFRQHWQGAEPTTREIHRAIRDHKKQLLNRYPHELSGGQLQRMMIAMALSCDPQLLIADEPTTALDVTVQATILKLLRELRDSRGMSMVFVSHDLGVVAQVADAIAVMYRGKIVEYNRADAIFNRPSHPYTKGLLACRPQLDVDFVTLPTVSDFMAESVDVEGNPLLEEKPVDLEMFSRPRLSDTSPEASTTQASASEAVTPEASAHPSPDASEKTIVRVKDLTVEYPVKTPLGQPNRKLKAVDHLSFEIHRGETLGLVGESGCGKSTLARALLRLIPTTSGDIWFDGTDIARMKERKLRRLRRDMQIIFQDPDSALDPRMSIAKAILEPMQIHGLTGNKQQNRENIAQLLQRVGLDAEAMDRYPHAFSGGQKQRICIARALALNPRFIICDESVSALDVSVQAQVLNLLKDLQADLGLTYLFISHDLSVVKFMSDRIIVMNQGRIEEMGDPEEIYQNPQKEYTQALIASIPQVNTYLESA